jgi:hypothetical protein
MNLAYIIVVSIPVKEHNIHIWHTSPLIPQVAHTHLTLRGQRCIRHKDVFTSYGSGHKTALGLYLPQVRSRDSSHDELQPLPHDRDYPQANFTLRQRVWGSHHPARGYLPSYHIVGASLQKSKLHKVTKESKSLLACHLLRLL